MSSSNVRLAVSVQAHGFAEKPWEGHLATGLLTEPGVVLVPASTDGIAEATEGIDLLVLPLPLGAGGRIERLVAERVTFCLVPGGEGARFALIRMANDSRHRPNVGEFTESELEEALKRHPGDLWAALAYLGAIEPGARDAVTPDLLRQVPAIEAAQREPEFEEPEDGLVPGGPCDVLPTCRKGTA
ncbi:hypothetical protein B0I31_11872 [Saccharothrix carnea]|uniref:Uncharacterized protein n=1 Tax=Saccharothrix carnea TaxID=1280637 RepID=A0A2P8HZX4_SACCR|nr:hypothetical protein [Saccharothrix carnea]PSL51759.1 hypothetical protein B0I31_11872 [Saccharothrix carnea]